MRGFAWCFGLLLVACGRIAYDPIPVDSQIGQGGRGGGPATGGALAGSGGTRADAGGDVADPGDAGGIVDADTPRAEAGAEAALEAPAPFPVSDAGTDAADADPGCRGGTFTQPLAVTIEGLTPDLYGPRLSGDARLLFVSQTRGPPFIDEDIWTLQRTPGTNRFGTPVRAGLGSSSFDGSPFPTRDGRALYFSSARPGGLGGRDLWVSRRAQDSGPWGTPTPVSELNSSGNEQTPSLSEDGLVVFFASDRDRAPRTDDLYTATRSSPSAPFSRPTRVAELSTDGTDTGPFITPDGLTIVFATDRFGAPTGLDLWAAARSTRSASFGSPIPLFGVSSFGQDEDPWLSYDGRELFFASNRDGNRSLIYRAVRCP